MIGNYDIVNDRENGSQNYRNGGSVIVMVVIGVVLVVVVSGDGWRRSL